MSSFSKARTCTRHKTSSEGRHPSGTSVGLKATLVHCFTPLVDGKDLKGALFLTSRPGGRMDSWNCRLLPWETALKENCPGFSWCSMSPVSATANGANQCNYSFHLCTKRPLDGGSASPSKRSFSTTQRPAIKRKRPRRTSGATCYHRSQGGVATFPSSWLPNANWNCSGLRGRRLKGPGR